MNYFTRVMLEAPTPVGWVVIAVFVAIIVFGIGSTFWKMRTPKDPNAKPQTKGKVRLTNRVKQGIVFLVFSTIITLVLGRPILVQQLPTTDVAHNAGWFTHVETDINYASGPALTIVQGEKNNGKVVKVNDVDYLYVVMELDEDGEIIPDKSFVYYSEEDKNALDIIVSTTNTCMEHGKEMPAEYHVKGTMSMMFPNERQKVVDYLVDNLDIEASQAEEMVGKYELINEAVADRNAILIFCGVLMAFSIVWIVVFLLKSRYI